MTNYTQLVAPRKGTQDGAGWCLRYAQSFFGAPVKHPSAWAAWNATVHKHGPNVPVPGGVAVLLWFSHYGTYGSPPTYGNWGHVAIHVSGDAIYTSPGSGWGFERWGTIAQIEQRFNCKYVGWSEDINGLRVVAPEALQPTQRQVGSNPVKRRADASTSSAEKQPPLSPGAVGTFNGWKYGEQVNDGIRNTNIWFRGHSGDWFWSGGFTSQDVTGLTDLNPKPPAVQPNQRQVDSSKGVNIRAAANTSAAVVGSLEPNAIVTPEGWLKGTKVDGIDYWYKLDKGYAWAGGFTVEDSSGLKDLTPVVVPDPEPQPEPAPEPEPAPDPKPLPPTNRVSVALTTPNWEKVAPDGSVEFPRHPLTGKDIVLPAYLDEINEEVSATGYNIGREGVVNHIVLHHTNSPYYSGVLNTLNGKGGAPTTNYVVKDTTIGKMVPEQDTPWTNTRWMSNSRSVTVEICNDKTPLDKPSQASHETAAWIAARSAVRHGIELPLEHGINVFGHKEVSKTATACPGELDIKWIVDRANEILAEGVIDDVEPDTAELLATAQRSEAAVKRIEDMLNRIFRDN